MDLKANNENFKIKTIIFQTYLFHGIQHVLYPFELFSIETNHKINITIYIDYSKYLVP